MTRRPHDERTLLAYAAELGWQRERIRDGWRFTHPDGGLVVAHKNRAGSFRVWRNVAADLRRTTRGRRDVA